MTEKNLPTVLEGIVARRRTHLAGIRERITHVDVKKLQPSRRSLFAALNGTNRLIMECKSASPSLGMIRKDYRPGDIARIYSRYADAISVLCEPEWFGGDYDHLQTVAQSTHLPVLCKDFIVDPIQVYAARYYGADAILLMMSIVDDETFCQLKSVADELGLDVLTEAITKEEVERALSFGVEIIGINNRNLHDLSIDLSRTERLAGYVPDNKVVVSESGIRDNNTIRRLGAHANAFLVGSQLTSQQDIDHAARKLLFGANKVCGLTAASTAQAARAAGASYGGLIFVPDSPRNVSRETAEKIIAAEPGLDYVAVSRADDPAELREVAATRGLSGIQLHAPFQSSVDGELALIERARTALAHTDAKLVWRAIDMNDPQWVEMAPQLATHADRLVLDSGRGGTGRSFDWTVIPEDIKAHSLLAGGLDLKKLNSALRVGTGGLDLNSGLETRPGHKDAALISQAFRTIRLFNQPHKKD